MATRQEAVLDPGEVEGPVLVTGGAGYIGSHTVRLLERAGIETVVVDNLSTGHREAVGVRLLVGDLGDRAFLRRTFREVQPRSVVHFAGRAYVGESVADPSLYYRENVLNSWHLVEAMRDVDCREIVFSSSCATYGIPDRVPIREDEPQRPISPYGRSKLQVEQMLDDYASAYGLRFSALRYFNAAGADPDGSLGEVHDPETHLIPLVLQVALGRRSEICIYGDDYPTPDGTCIRDYVHVVDLARAHLMALARLQAGSDRIICNLGTGVGHSVAEVVEAVRRVAGRPVAARVVERRPGDPPRLVSEAGLARRLLAWEPRYSSLDQMIGDAWRFADGHPEGFSSRPAA